MSDRILLTLPDPEMREVVRDLVEERWSRMVGGEEEPIFEEVGTEKEARQHLAAAAGEFRLLITGLDIPADRKSPCHLGEERGFSLLKFCRDENLDLARIVVADTIDDRLSAEATHFPGCRLLSTGQYLETGLTNTLNDLLGRIARRRAADRGDADRGDADRGDADRGDADPGRAVQAGADQNQGEREVTVDIFLAGANQGYRICADQVIEGDLHLDQEQIGRLITDTKSIETQDYPDWKNLLSRVGRDLYLALRSSVGFIENLYASLGSKELERVRFRFTVKKDTYPIALEAISGPGATRSGEPFWMLQAPMSRKLAKHVQWRTDPLFFGDDNKDEAINFLILEADVEGRVREARDGPTLLKLSNVPEEGAWLEAFLQEKKRTQKETPDGCLPRIGEICRIHRQGLVDRSFTEELHEALDERTWHLVHYAGHSWYDQDFIHPETRKSGRGYFFFPGHAGRRYEMVAAEDFATWIRNKSRFVYLSSCHSSEDDIVYELAGNLIPAIVGFRWDIADDKALIYAKVLYESLFAASGSIEKAFLEARKEMHKKYRDDKSWASPMLILQVAT